MKANRNMFNVNHRSQTATVQYVAIWLNANIAESTNTHDLGEDMG